MATSSFAVYLGADNQGSTNFTIVAETIISFTVLPVLTARRHDVIRYVEKFYSTIPKTDVPCTARDKSPSVL